MQVALEAQEDFYRLMARGKLGQTGFRQWLRTSAYNIQQVTCCSRANKAQCCLPCQAMSAMPVQICNAFSVLLPVDVTDSVKCKMQGTRRQFCHLCLLCIDSS